MAREPKKIRIEGEQLKRLAPSIDMYEQARAALRDAQDIMQQASDGLFTQLATETGVPFEERWSIDVRTRGKGYIMFAEPYCFSCNVVHEKDDDTLMAHGMREIEISFDDRLPPLTIKPVTKH